VLLLAHTDALYFEAFIAFASQNRQSSTNKNDFSFWVDYQFNFVDEIAVARIENVSTAFMALKQNKRMGVDVDECRFVNVGDYVWGGCRLSFTLFFVEPDSYRHSVAVLINFLT